MSDQPIEPKIRETNITASIETVNMASSPERNVQTAPASTPKKSVFAAKVNRLASWLRTAAVVGKGRS